MIDQSSSLEQLRSKSLYNHIVTIHKITIQQSLLHLLPIFIEVDDYIAQIFYKNQNILYSC